MDVELRRKVCRLIAGIVVSDDDLDSAEESFIDRMLVRFGIPAEERESIFPIVDANDAREAMQELPPEVQQEAVTLLVAAAVVDGHVSKEERVYLHTVADAIGISTGSMDVKIDDALKIRHGKD